MSAVAKPDGGVSDSPNADNALAIPNAAPSNSPIFQPNTIVPIIAGICTIVRFKKPKGISLQVSLRAGKQAL